MTRGTSLLFRGRRRLTALLSVFLTLIFFSVSPAAEARSILSGVVLDENGSPIEGAIVSVWVGRNPVASTRTGVDGRFDVDFEAEARYAVYVLADDNSTPGVDYLPSRFEAEPSEGDDLRLMLVPAASLILEGDVQFVESDKLPLSIVYDVSDPLTGRVMNVSGFTLRYGSASEAQSLFLGLEPSHLVVPAGVPFSVEVVSSVLVGSRAVTRSFQVDMPSGFPLNRGDRIAVDVRRYSIPSNLGVVEALHGGVESRIKEMETVRFYLEAEKEAVASALRQLSDSKYMYENGLYIESFDSAKMSYIELRQTKTELEVMYRDAETSVHILIALLALASAAIAFLLSNNDLTKLLSYPIIYAVSLAVLYFTYPGSIIVPLELFAMSATIAFAAALMVALVFPRFLRGRGGDGHVPVRNIVVPIFSIAKRGIRRRRLRFALTLISLTVLVMSFVSLTSFSEGYGILVGRVSGRGASRAGVLIRASGYTEEMPVFIKQTDVESGWLERQPESGSVSPKAENFPLPWAVAMLKNTPIYGVVGFDPGVESEIIDLVGVMRDGEPLSEEGIMISEKLRRELDLEVGDRLSLDGNLVTLQGVFDDEAFRRLRDLDGSEYIPRKLEDISPEEERPTLVLRSCDPSEIVVTHLSTAVRMPFVGVTRIGIAVEDGYDVNAFAERLALELGYQAWSSSPDGVYHARLSGYLEGKGLPLIVPWIIVILNVVVTMLNSMYERKREIHILSSVGVNPAQIAFIFVAEASIIGIVAGGVGYLSGLILYRAMALLDLALEVHQKISAFWSLASIGIAMTAVLMGALAALRGSVVITPSLMRRWKFDRERGDHSKPWETSIPVKILPEEVEGFVDFVVRDLRARENRPVWRVSSIRLSSEADGAVKRVDFVYRDGQTQSFYTRNTLLVERRTCGAVAVTLRTYSDREWAHIAGTLVRMIAMRWSTVRAGLGASARS